MPIEAPGHADGDVLAVLAAEANRLVEPLVRAAQYEHGRRRLLRVLGWDLELLTGFPVDDLETAAQAVGAAAEQVAELAEEPVLDLATAQKLLGAVAAVVEAVRQVEQLAGASTLDVPLDVAEALSGIGQGLVEYLVAEYLSAYHPVLHDVLRALTLVDTGEDYVLDPTPALTDASGEVVYRRPAVPPRFRLGRLADLLTDPAGTLRDDYLGDGMATIEDARDVAAGLFTRLAPLLMSLGAGVSTGADVPDVAGRADIDPQRTIAFSLPIGRGTAPDGSDLHVGVVLHLLSDAEGGARAVVLPTGWANHRLESRSWVVEVRVGGQLGVFSLGPGGVDVSTGGALTLDIGVQRVPNADTGTTVIGAAQGTRLELGPVRFGAGVDVSTDDWDARLLAEVASSALVVGGGEADGFLSSFLPADGLRIPFDTGLTWSRTGGLRFTGGPGRLELSIRVDVDLFGVLTMDTVHLAVKTGDDAISGEASTTVAVHLGPVTVAVERIGLKAVLTFPPTGGNLGVADVDLGFKMPSGAGLAIDAGVVVGGGYLYFDEEKQQYAGVVHLELTETLSLTAVGLLTTRMPDGSPGFSLLVLIAATFAPPIQLGYGFTLNGIGGLIAVNRTVAIDPLRAGLRSGSLGSVLFPTDPIRNAPQIISDLSAIFPPAPGRFLVGPMVQLGWGTPTLLTIELGLVLELPEPVRLLILGRLRVTLPAPDAPVVRLQLDSVGLVDFASGDVSLDAVLFDSRVAAFSVTGAMALRANFGARPDMVLAIGGFNPRYRPPAGFPVLEPVAISLAAGDNPRLRLEAYLAVTTNTVQFGARLELFAKAGPFSIAGLLALDVLVQLAPFGFVADLAAMLALKYDNKSVMSVGLQMTLSGPTPWHAWGTASYKVLIFSGSIDFDVRIGPAQKPALPSPVDIRPLLTSALGDPDNWATEVPRGEHPVVSLRGRTGGTGQLVHPLADLRVTQKVAPLGREISRFGAVSPQGERIFGLGIVAADGTVRWTEADGVRPVTEMFAPAQFRQMADDEKLMAPAFEPMQSGVRFGEPGYTCGSAVVEPEIVYARETIHRAIPSPAEPDTVTVRSVQPAAGGELLASAATRTPESSTVMVREDLVLTTDFLQQVAGSGAAAQAPIARTGGRRFETSSDGVLLRAPAFAVVTGRNVNATVEAPSKPGGQPGPREPAEKPSYTEAVETLGSRVEKRPGERGRRHVVPVYQGAIQ